MTQSFGNGRIAVRPATAADLARLLEFRLAMLADLFSDESRAEAARAARRADPVALRQANERWLGEHFGHDYAAWIADVDGTPEATAGLLWFAHPPGPVNPSGLEAYILNVYTRPDARRMGLARALVERVVEQARAAGVRRIWLRASADGRPLYEAMGFRPGDYLQLTSE
jgi:GNAT superfamily N-acetyltransferase